MKRIYIFLLVIISYNSGLIACKVNVDSLLNYHISSIDEYLTGVIDGYFLPNGGSRLIERDILGRRVKTDYTDSTKFRLSGNNANFLEIIESLGFCKLERDFHNNSILMSRKDLEIIKDWYIKNKENLNYIKIEEIFLWHKNYNKNTRGGLSDPDIYSKYREKLKDLEKLDTFIK